MVERIKKNYGMIFTASLVFALFAVCTYWTPLAGDDWGYAINGMKENPFVMAFQFYFSWSGRFFSELWGFIVAPNKWLWNVLNPLLFTGIVVCLNLIANPGKKISLYVISVCLMLFVSAYLRMETYSWIMGTTYVVPLFLSFLYFANCVQHIRKNTEWSTLEIMLFSFVQLYIGLTMENIAAVMVLAHILMIVRTFLHKTSCKRDLCFLIISLASFIIMRSSPGSAYRLSENTAWLNLSLAEQLMKNLPSFLRYTFYDNKYLVGFLSGVLCWSVFVRSSEWKWKGSAIILFGIVVFLLLANKLYSMTGLPILQWLSSYESNFYSSIVQTSFWCVYIVYLFIVFSKFYSGNKREFLLFFLLLAGASNIVMLISPIFGSRSSLYFYYFSLVLAMCLLDEIYMSKKIYVVFNCIVLGLCLYRGYDTVKRYKMVNLVHQDRLVKIQYYLDHPEEKDVWLPRMPIYTVHGADIEVDDTYHMTVFKAYYGLADDCVLHFYVEE